MKTKKISKDDASYVKRSSRPNTCADCRMFRFPNKCSLVKGNIQRDGYCQFWTDKPRED